MRKWLIGGCMLAALATGCGSSSGGVTPETPPGDLAHLGDKTDRSLKDWLAGPRAELARLNEEWSDKVRKQREHARDNPQSVDLLPGLRPPSAPPGFREAAYSPREGFSLPPYAKPGDRDAGVALHLARLGDREAALKLADPADENLLAKIDACRAERDYPVEWTRLVGLAFESAELELADGEPQAAVDLIQMHRQLRALLDAKAAAGPLGAALLPRGRRAVTEAAAAWRKPNVRQPLLADGAAAALKEWGDSPAPAPLLPPGAARDDAARLLQAAPTGRTVAVADPAAVRRALDLLELPAPPEAAQAVVGFFDGEGRLAEWLVLYRGGAIQTYPDPASLAHALIDHGLPGGPNLNGSGLREQTFAGGDLSYEAGVLARGEAIGAFDRVAAAAPAPAADLPPEARDFGAVHLDRTFESNRAFFAPEKEGKAVSVAGKAVGQRLRLPDAAPAPTSATLRRGHDADLSASLQLGWWADARWAAAVKVALALWAAYGPARIETIEDPGGDALALVWEDARTRLTLRLPYDPTETEFLAEDVRGGDPATRLREAEAFDQAQRKGRLDAGKPLARLPRWQHLPGVTLGLTRAQALDALPKKASVRRLDLGADVSLVFNDDPPKDAPFAARQVFLRFGPDDRLAEIRVRYQEIPAAIDDKHPALLTTLRDAEGAPQELPAPWAGLWPELTAQAPDPALFRWFDDRTVLTLQRDGGGAEAVLRDWPAGKPLAAVADLLPPLTFCDRGAGGAALGDAKADVLKKFPDHQPLDGGAFALTPPAGGPYDSLAVWFDGDRVSRVVARRRAKPADAGDATARILEAWGRDFARLGWPRRQDGAAAPVVQAFGWHDDRVRVRTLAQEGDEGLLRLFTEWRAWPVAKP
jgi:hypothetical protein